MAHRIFSIPEILRLICKSLGSYYLNPVLTVSRPFFISAIPFVWQSVHRSGKLRNLVFPNIDINHIDYSWVNSITPLDDESLDRFNLYAPYIKRIDDYISWKREDANWAMLLRAVPARPLLPNLQLFSISDRMQSVPVNWVIDALLCPTLVQIRIPGRRSGSPSPVLSPQRIARIAELCPKLQILQLYSKPVHGNPQIASASRTPPSDSLLKSLGQLNALRFLGAGPELLSYDALVLLGNLPSLESLMILIPSNTPEQSIPSQFPQSTGSFLALQHLGIYYKSPSVVSRLWRTLPFVQQVTSIWIKVDTDILSDDEDIIIRDLLSSVFRFSPHVIDFCLDLNSEEPALSLELFTPEIISLLARLPLQRMGIRTAATQLVPPEGYEQIAMALPNVEYLDIQDCHFTFQGLECVAKHMPKLQCLAVALYSSEWPSKDELPLAPSSSPSVLCLQSHFTVDTRSSEPYDSVDNAFVESISIGLHRLWPNGVHCRPSELASSFVEQADSATLELINSSIKRLCSPNEFKAPDMHSAAEWKYINSDIEYDLPTYLH